MQKTKDIFLAWMTVSGVAACDSASVGFGRGTVCRTAQGLPVNPWCHHPEFKVSLAVPS